MNKQYLLYYAFINQGIHLNVRVFISRKKTKFRSYGNFKLKTKINQSEPHFYD